MKKFLYTKQNDVQLLCAFIKFPKAFVQLAARRLSIFFDAAFSNQTPRFFYNIIVRVKSVINFCASQNFSWPWVYLHFFEMQLIRQSLERNDRGRNTILYSISYPQKHVYCQRLLSCHPLKPHLEESTVSIFFTFLIETALNFLRVMKMIHVWEWTQY